MKSDTSEPLVLSAIKSVADDQPNFEVIVYRSCEILASIERWDHASSESPFVMDIIRRVQEQGANFKDAIRSSRESAQHGSKFCADFVTLLEVLGDSSTSRAEIRDHIHSMQRIASEAHASAQSAAEMFQVIRHGIYDITSDVPGEVVKLEAKQKHVQRKLDISERRAQRVKVVKAVSAAGAAIAAGVSIVAFPPAMIVLPVQKREKEKTSYEEQIGVLKDVADTMVEFGSAVDFFAQYWIRMETILHVVNDRVDDLRGKKHLKMRLMTIKKDWEVVNSNFLDYVHKVSRL
ncbi:hypothetical protein BDZ94DRAFT_178521 [Collybia nuda]|uniref:Uncharacterized protein n=1 Tax=Collybia nuda TaxID=64659 RepID=A0A9P5YCX0_9AGAR|nr:hypothetical protein BDZ94DRAFT_178521 [Collybia nuda]